MLDQECKCPMCFIRWEDKNKQVHWDSETIYKKCDFCDKNPDSLELLLRQIDIMPKADMSDLPKVLKHLIQHLDLKPAK